MTESKERIDILLVERGYFDSRERAKAAVMAGLVFVEQERIEKAGSRISRSLPLTVKGAPHPYVGRGGLKMEKAIKTFDIDMTGKVMMDIGASTGGFTDCALKNGAAYVFAIDVGYNQLDWSLRNHPNVGVMERTNFRYVQKEDLQGPDPDLAAIDVSFISLKLILPVVKAILGNRGSTIALIKPQFEAGREKVGKSGVVRSPDVHREVLRDILSFASEQQFSLSGLTYSPITGGEGNIEFLAYWTLDSASASSAKAIDQLIEAVVAEAHGHFAK